MLELAYYFQVSIRCVMLIPWFRKDRNAMEEWSANSLFDLNSMWFEKVVMCKDLFLGMVELLQNESVTCNRKA